MSQFDEDMVSTRRFKESLNGLIQHIWGKDHLCGPNNDNSSRDLQGVVSMIQAVE